MLFHEQLERTILLRISTLKSSTMIVSFSSWKFDSKTILNCDMGGVSDRHFKNISAKLKEINWVLQIRELWLVADRSGKNLNRSVVVDCYLLTLKCKNHNNEKTTIIKWKTLCFPIFDIPKCYCYFSKKDWSEKRNSLRKTVLKTDWRLFFDLSDKVILAVKTSQKKLWCRKYRGKFQNCPISSIFVQWRKKILHTKCVETETRIEKENQENLYLFRKFKYFWLKTKNSKIINKIQISQTFQELSLVS